ncbi:olfactory receptor 2D2-like [Pelobates fuscus]|uniref:olfactory receptor 2D2-like n=1 Tax=Pelobates fuscus TaxID=191477 RepID=UPI002FE4DF88
MQDHFCVFLGSSVQGTITLSHLGLTQKCLAYKCGAICGFRAQSRCRQIPIPLLAFCPEWTDNGVQHGVLRRDPEGSAVDRGGEGHGVAARAAGSPEHVAKEVIHEIIAGTGGQESEFHGCSGASRGRQKDSSPTAFGGRGLQRLDGVDIWPFVYLLGTEEGCSSKERNTAGLSCGLSGVILSKMASHKLFKEIGNASIVTEFILLGLSTDPNAQVLLFIVFLIIYMATLAGNILLITAVKTDKRLHSSMYLFLANLAFMDICYTSIIIPRMLRDFLTMNKLISLKVCTVQIFFYLFLAESECVLLAFMAYDRYVAICNPLRYNIVMNIPFCTRMIAAAWMTGYVISFVDALFLYWLKYCDPKVIDHFFCESASLIELVCHDYPVLTIVIYVGDAILLLTPVVLVLFSYIRIIASIVRIRSGGSKSFSTCFSHLIVVVLFYGTAMFTYMRPRHAVTHATGKLVSVFYTIVTPMLNPLIYSLRNKDVQRAVKKIARCISFT